MSYIMLMLCLGVLVGLSGLCCSTVTYFGVVCVVVSCLFCCGLVAVSGVSFISLLLFIVYLGGMMVVFAYSVAMTEDFNFVLSKASLLDKKSLFLCCFIGVSLFVGILCGFASFSSVSLDYGLETSLFDGVGVALLYSFGWVGLMVCAWSLLLALFVVVELVRAGFHGGSLRTV